MIACAAALAGCGGGGDDVNTGTDPVTHSSVWLGAQVMTGGVVHHDGVPIALGTDGSGANDNLILQEAMRAAATLQVYVSHLRKALEPVYQDVAKRIGQPLIDEFLKETRGATN